MKDILIVVLVIILIGVIGYIFYQQGFNKNNNVEKTLEIEKDFDGDGGIGKNEEQKTAIDEKLIGGDKDEHGCLIGAGYSWCEKKQKCLRNWEEECFESSRDGIAKALAVEHQKDVSEVSVNITQEIGNYAKGGVEFAPGGMGNGGLFLAVKLDGEWNLVYDGNGNPDCEALKNKYIFPSEMLKNFCY